MQQLSDSNTAGNQPVQKTTAAVTERSMQNMHMGLTTGQHCQGDAQGTNHKKAA